MVPVLLKPLNFYLNIKYFIKNHPKIEGCKSFVNSDIVKLSHHKGKSYLGQNYLGQSRWTLSLGFYLKSNFY